MGCALYVSPCIPNISRPCMCSPAVQAIQQAQAEDEKRRTIAELQLRLAQAQASLGPAKAPHAPAEVSAGSRPAEQHPAKRRAVVQQKPVPQPVQREEEEADEEGEDEEGGGPSSRPPLARGVKRSAEQEKKRWEKLHHIFQSTVKDPPAEMPAFVEAMRRASWSQSVHDAKAEWPPKRLGKMADWQLLVLEGLCKVGNKAAMAEWPELYAALVARGIETRAQRPKASGGVKTARGGPRKTAGQRRVT